MWVQFEGEYECIDGRYRCSIGKQQECINGSWGEETTCEFGCNISTGVCNPTCQDGSNRCEGNVSRHCFDGTGWNAGIICESGCNTITGKCNGSQLSLGNICTNLTQCYDNKTIITCPASMKEDFFGQDAQYAALGVCIPQSFSVQALSGQNVVLDNNTNLMWQQEISDETYTWENAISYCEDLNYAGYSDWRLPSPQEFLTIIDNSKVRPATNTMNFPNMPIGKYFWTNKEFPANKAPSFHSSYGYIISQSKTTDSIVMCVRGNELMEPIFTEQTLNGDIVVTDSVTGLMWQKTHQATSWMGTMKYCENLTYAGYSDWRVPNKNELASLLNYDKISAPYSNLPDDMPDYFWSSSPSLDTSVYGIYQAWIVNFNGGLVSSSSRTGYYYVRCVR